MERKRESKVRREKSKLKSVILWNFIGTFRNFGSEARPEDTDIEVTEGKLLEISRKYAQKILCLSFPLIQIRQSHGLFVFRLGA